MSIANAALPTGEISRRTNLSDGAPSPFDSLRDESVARIAVPLRVKGSDGRIRSMEIIAISLGAMTEEICLNGQTIGFISRVGQIFVAQAGNRWDRAEECGQYHLWDKAATILVALQGRLPELESDSRTGALENETGSRTSDAGPAQHRHSPGVRELSRSGGQK